MSFVHRPLQVEKVSAEYIKGGCGVCFVWFLSIHFFIDELSVSKSHTDEYRMVQYRLCAIDMQKIEKGSLTIKRASFPSILIISSTNKFESIFASIEWMKTSYLLVLGLYMCTKPYSTRFLCLSLHFYIRIYRVLNFFLYEAVPSCDTQLPLHDKCRIW